MIEKFLNLTNKLGKRDFIIFCLVVFFTIICSFLELLGIGLLASFALVINDSSFFIDKIFLIDLKNYLKQLEKVDIIIFISILIIAAIIIKNLILFLTSFVEIKILKKIQLKLKEKIYNYYLSIDYDDFTNKKKSDFINEISSQTSNFMGYLYNCMVVFKELTLVLIILVGMLIVNWKIILMLITILFALSYFFIVFFKKKLNLLGELARDINSQEIKHLDETYQSYKIIKLERKVNFFSSLLLSIVKRKNHYEIIHFLIGKIPKIYLEIVVVVLFLSIVLFLFIMMPNNNTFFGAITFFAFSIIRLMPSFISINNAYSSLAFFKVSFENLYEMINKIDSISTIIPQNKFNNLSQIEIKNLCFSFKKNKKKVLKNINFEIYKGDILGLIGPSGTGKSTLLNLIIGLLNPTEGKIIFNKIGDPKKIKTFEKYKISYIPQDPFVLNGTLLENIAFGEKNVNLKRFNDSLNFSNLSDFANKYNTDANNNIIMEGKLSHGEKQRIGLARAYYNDNELIIFDESFNALDNKNENIVLNNVTKWKNKIIIIVAHRTETLRFCDKLLILGDGKVVDFGTKNEILVKHSNLKKYFKSDNEAN